MYPHHQGTTSPIQHVYPHPSDPRLRGLGYGPVMPDQKKNPYSWVPSCGWRDRYRKITDNRNPCVGVRSCNIALQRKPDLSLRRADHKCAYGHLSIADKVQGNREYQDGPPEHALILGHCSFPAFRSCLMDSWTSWKFTMSRIAAL